MREEKRNCNFDRETCWHWRELTEVDRVLVIYFGCFFFVFLLNLNEGLIRGFYFKYFGVNGG